MTDAQLTALSTLAWLIGTTTLFILLAHWSAGGTWGISSAIARGLTGWSGREAEGPRPSAAEVRPMQTPEMARLWGAVPEAGPQTAESDQVQSELVDLGVRRLD